METNKEQQRMPKVSVQERMLKALLREAWEYSRYHYGDTNSKKCPMNFTEWYNKLVQSSEVDQTLYITERLGLPMDYHKWIFSCVIAMQGIEDPEQYVKDAEYAKEKMPEIISGIEELSKYKTACESINPDNPMAVADNLKQLFYEVKAAMECVDEIDNFYLTTGHVMRWKRLLTKIQEGK